jgi:uncharacterized membrane protein
MFRTKPNLVLPVFGIILTSIEPALASTPLVPAPVVGAGLPVLAVLCGGYWLVRKLRKLR